MKAIGLFFVIEAFAIDDFFSTSSYKDVDHKENPGSTILFNIGDFAFESTTTKPWWNGLNITKYSRTTVITTTEFSPVANMSLSPQEVIDLIGDLDNLNSTIVKQTVKIFGKNKPDLNELVFKWLFELVNKTEVDNDTTFATVTSAEETENTIDIRKLTTKFTDDEMLWHENELFVTDSIEAEKIDAENIHRQGANSGIAIEDNFQGIPPMFDPNDPLGFKQKKIPPSFQGNEGLTAGRGRYQGTAPSDGFFTYPPGNSPWIAPELQNQYQQIHHQDQHFQNNPPTHQDNQGVSEFSQYNTAMVHTTSGYPLIPTPGLITQETPQRLEGNASPNVPDELATATSTALAPAARQDYGNMLDPDLQDMFPQYEHGPPSMAHDPGSLLIGIVTTPTTTTLHALVNQLKLKMVENRNGYFSSFITKLFELVAVKEKHAAARLFAATDLETNDLEQDGTLREFGIPFLPATLKSTQLMVGADPEIVQNQASIGYQMMKNRHAFLEPNMNKIIDGIDSLYTIEEGDILLLALVDVAEYPGNNLTSRAVARTVIHRLLAPYRRLAGTDRLRAVINKINHEINFKLPGRRSAPRRMTHVRNDRTRDKIEARGDRIERNTARNTNDGNIKGKIGDNREGRYRKKDGRYIADGINRTKHTYDRNRSKKSFHNVKNNRDTNIRYKRRKPIETDLTKQTKNIHVDFKNASREDNNLRHRYKNKKKVTSTINDRNGHGYKKRLKNSFVRNANLGKKTFAGEKNKRLKPTIYNVKKRFEVINTYKLNRNKEMYIENVFNKTTTDLLIPDSAAQENQDKKIRKITARKSKYLAQYPYTRMKSRIESNRLMSELFSNISKNDAEEMYLKFRLKDAMIHGHRKFIERRNLRPTHKKKLYDISDYSDKDVVIKSQLYKEFYKKSAQSHK